MFKGPELAEISEVIVSAFDKDGLARLLRDTMNVRLGDEVNLDKPYRKIVDDTLDVFDRDGRLPYLLAHAAGARPMRDDVQNVYRTYAEYLLDDSRRAGVTSKRLAVLEHYGLLPTIELQDRGTRVKSTAATEIELQRLIRPSIPEIDPVVFATRLLGLSRRVCLVEIDGKANGTGFLVGRDVVLTNHHVVQPALGTNAKLTFRFDYQRVPGRDTDNIGVIIRALDWPAWEVDAAPVEGAASEDDNLDFALVRLGSPIGDDRGWITVPQTEHPLAPGASLMILQHPRGASLKLTLDTSAIVDTNTRGTRVRYTTNTERGASGSPCFDLRLELVALHHGSDIADPKHPNQGIPIFKIRSHLGRRGVVSALGA